MLDDTHEHVPAESAERRRAHHLLTVVLPTTALLGIGVAVGDVMVAKLTRINRDVVWPAITKRPKP
jgi:hypothetical protein